jgi:hypothetical protein
MRNTDNSTDISDSNRARRTALAEAAIVLERRGDGSRTIQTGYAKMPAGPIGPAAAWIYDPGRAELRVIADVLALRRAHRKDRCGPARPLSRVLTRRCERSS